MEISDAETMTSALEKLLKKNVTIALDSGEQLEGTVETVGRHLMQLASLSGMESYDAVLRIDRISAIRFRAREY